MHIQASSWADAPEDEGSSAYVYVENSSNSKPWVDLSGDSENNNILVGVTPGKVYDLLINMDANNTGYERAKVELSISYSKSINEKIPDIIDY